MSNVVVCCKWCGYALEDWEFEYSNTYCTICQNLSGFDEDGPQDDFPDYDREWDMLD